jgi:hypothetical protein
MRHRTALITAGAIAAVVFASAIAVGANLGILTVADSIPVGKLTATTVASATVAPTSAPSPASAFVGAQKTADSQKYIIRKAGVVEVSFSKSGVRLVDVAARRHWRWTLTQTRDRKLTVTFKHGSATYTFMAVVGRHGKLTARVDHPITKVAPSAPSTSSTSWVAAPAPAPSPASAPQASGGESGHAGDSSQEGGGQDD